MKYKTLLFAALAAASITASQASIVTGLDLTGNGSVDGAIKGDFLNFTLTGGNDGSESFSSTQLVGNVLQSGNFSFSWSYFTQDGSLFDPAGYVIDGAKTFLVDGSNIVESASGTATVALLVGQSFGWFVDSSDNALGAGNLSITANNTSVAGVPEPSEFMLGALPALLGGVALLRRRVVRKAEL
jgi:hypothetical protein